MLLRPSSSQALFMECPVLVQFLPQQDPSLRIVYGPPPPPSYESFLPLDSPGFEYIPTIDSYNLLTGDSEAFNFSTFGDTSGLQAAQPILSHHTPESQKQQTTPAASAPMRQTSGSQGLNKVAKERRRCPTCLGSHSRPVRYQECQNKAIGFYPFECHGTCGNPEW